MIDRLVLGSGSLLHTLVTSLRDQSGTLRVGTEDESLIRSLQDNGIDVVDPSPEDAEALSTLDVEFVVVTAETRTEVQTVATAAREAFPDAYLLVYTGAFGIGGTANGDSLDQIADKVVALSERAGSYVLDRIGDSGRQMYQLWSVLRDIDNLAVVTHDNPDPDAIASGLALARIARAAGCEASVCYHGDITHQENRAFVNVLDLDLCRIDEEGGLAAFDGIALVDHSRPGVNDQLPDDSDVDIVIDHHPPRAPVNARFVDLRGGVGATSTLLVGYLDLFGLEFDQQIATALLFGIHVDTNAFSREVSPIDFEAAATLVSAADLGALERIESPSVSASTIDTLASAIQNRRTVGGVLMSCVGQLAERDALAQAADRLLMLDDVGTTMVYGVLDGTIYISARSRGTRVDIGEALRDAFNQIGSAGGHVNMAGGQIELGILDAVDEQTDSFQDILEDVVEDRFLSAVDEHTTEEVTDGYSDLDSTQYQIDSRRALAALLPDGRNDEFREGEDSDPPE
jgi:nanoRNase/pAp phosphatase (c-di-AMP/oligoRNAs hydrolase)